MAMDPLLVQAIRDGHKIVHLVTVALPDHTIRWTDAGQVRWGANVYRAKDPTYGALDSIGKITDGVDGAAAPVPITILVPTLDALADLAALDAQGGAVSIHLGAVHQTTGQLIGEPYRLHFGELDQPRLAPGPVRRLEYDVIAGDAWGLQPNEEQRQSDAFHQSIWPGELHYQFQTDGTKFFWWRDDEPKNAINGVTPRGKVGAMPTEFNYDINAPWPFPFGRVAVGGNVNFRVSYDATNRYHSIASTVAASGPIHAWVKSYFDDEDTSFDPTLEKATNGDHEGFMWLQTKLGTQPQAALTSPTGTGAGIPAPGRTTDHKASGKAVCMWTGFENSKKDEFRGGVPRTIHVLEGLLGWDGRIEGCDIADPATWVYIEDGATAAKNWAIGRWEGSDGAATPTYGAPYSSALVGGIGAPLDAIDVTAFAACADVADINAWKVAGVPLSNDDKNDVLDWLLEAAGAARIRKCGMISCFSRGAVQDSLLTVTARDTAGKPAISLGPSRLERKNTAIGEFWSENHRWEMTPIAEVTDEDWRTEDGGRKRSTGFQYRYVGNADQCAQLTYLDLADGREAIHSAPFKAYMLQIEPGDCFTWEEPEFLLEGVKVRALKRSYDPSTFVVEIEHRTETDAKVAAALAMTGTTPPATTPVTPPEPEAEPPSSLSTSLAGSTVNIEWRNPTDPDFLRSRLFRGSTTVFGAATQILNRVGGLGELETYADTPGTGTWYYWVQAEGLDPSYASDPLGPESETVP